MHKPFVLIIMDGWGSRKQKDNNAILLAKDQTVNNLAKKYPSTELGCSGESVGLPEGQMGNSEVGHLNIGAGRIVYQDLTRITKSIKDGDFFDNKELLAAVENSKEHDSSIHFMGLLSDGGVHSDNKHLYALLDLAKRSGLKKVYIHAFLDGRDTPPSSAINYLKELQDMIKKKKIGQISTIIGRYYAMDRDKRWERVKMAYDAMVQGLGVEEDDPIVAIQNAYNKKETDEFVKPIVLKKDGKSNLIAENDSVVFFNFRSDRAREITRAIIDEKFDGFERKVRPDIYFVCMTEYDVTFNAPIAFPQNKLKNILAEVISRNGLKQLRIAETEKYAHVTFFFNGGVEKPYPGEERILIQSPKIATYDLKPEMSAYEVTDTVIREIESGKHDVIIMNYANGDMVGHTGILNAAISAIEAVNKCVGRVVETVQKKEGITIVTADHGNAEQMYDPKTHGPHTAHTCDKVPFILISKNKDLKFRKDGILADISPTMLDLLGIEKPEEMTGNSIIQH